MPVHSELTALAVVILAALVCGMVMTRLKQPAVVGYIFAGVLLGPSVITVIEDRQNITFLAELGVLMLLFLIGMELSLRDFREVWKVSVAATVLQTAISLLVMLGLSFLFEWPLPVAVLFAFVVALSSTAVVIKMLEQTNILKSPAGRLTLGILIAQDLAVVPMMLVIGAFGAGGFGPAAAVKLVASVALLAGLIWHLSRSRRINLPFTKVVIGHADLAPLSGLAYCFGAAALAGMAGFSPAFGAFLAGLVIGNSTARRTMLRGTRPIQSVLLMIFFLSIGLLIDLDFIWDNIGTVLLLLLLVTVLKTGVNIAILHLLREPWPHAFIAGVMLAQIGEFSFVLGTAGVAAGVIGDADYSLIVAVAAFSLLISPLWQLAARRILRVLLLSVTSLSETMRALGGRQARRGLALLGQAVGSGWRTVRDRRARRRRKTGSGGRAWRLGAALGRLRALAGAIRERISEWRRPAPPVPASDKPSEGAEIIDLPARKKAAGDA